MQRRPLALSLCVSWLLGCGGPLMVFPGGALDGPVKSPPADFSFAADAGTIQLETDPAEPYSVNIACSVIAGRLYVNAGDTKAQWVENMEADPAVRLRIEGEIYELTAHRVTDDAELQAFAVEWTKNSWARDPTKLEVAYVFRMEPRTP